MCVYVHVGEPGYVGSGVVTKCSGKSNLRVKGGVCFRLKHRPLRREELEAADHVVSEGRKKTAMRAGAKLTFSFIYISESQPME